ncbi:vinorine synthase-like [Cucumis melo var. makuwa]|uniref:Vinorine synthase-like n=2 Tax=Cucumis melo TaxID=3656 RepID=A0A5A7UPB9_CUCMM|nr:vinorine synthase-like [Cucumis melo var. makuwa]TYJ99233.1 vinorine synthase-like [Cucumis melo var. makuwa]
MEMNNSFNVEIISTEIIKPSSPTPSTHQHHKLSFLDQFAPGSYTPLLFFYPGGGDDHIDRCRKLKESLAETLSRFYLLAGTLVEAYLVECNDEGVPFSEARVSGHLSEVMENPNDVVSLHRLLPFHPDVVLERECILGVQYNVFECGGAVIAVCVTHKVVDGTSTTMFTKAWASTCRGDNKYPIVPTFDSTKLFPAMEIRGRNKRHPPMHKIVTRRFIFNKSNIAALKKQANSAALFLNQRPPSRVESVSGFLWNRFIALSHKKTPTKAKRFAVIQAVNLRNRMNPPLPQHSFGNIWWFATADVPIDEKQDFPSLVGKIREAIKEIDDEYTKTLEDTEKSLRAKMKMGERVYSGEVELFSFTSWCNFPVYETDFGWGKPTWVCSPGRPFKNVVLFVNTSDGEGIEAWVNLEKNDMALFENDSELLSFTSSS